MLRVMWYGFGHKSHSLRDHTSLTSTEKGGGGVLKFVTCLCILLFLNNRSIIRFCEWWGWEGQKIGIFFVDVIIGWPLRRSYSEFSCFSRFRKLSKEITSLKRILSLSDSLSSFNIAFPQGEQEYVYPDRLHPTRLRRDLSTKTGDVS